MRNVFEIPSAINIERAGIADADARREPLPFAGECRENLLSLADGGEETTEQRAIARAQPPSNT